MRSAALLLVAAAALVAPGCSKRIAEDGVDVDDRERPPRGWTLASAWSTRRAAALAALLWSAPVGAQQALRFEAMDENGDGSVDIIEFMERTKEDLDTEGQENKELRRNMYRFAESLYRECDTNGDGVLSSRELEFAVYFAIQTSLRAKRDGRDISEYMVAGKSTALQDLDADGDGEVSAEDFVERAAEDLAQWGFDEQSLADPQARQWLQRVFDAADLNHNGLLDSFDEVRRAEFYVFDDAMGFISHGMLREMDTNVDGEVDWEEVEASVAASAGRGSAHYVRQGFEAADLDGDGQLDAMELYRLFVTLLARAAFEDVHQTV